MPAIHRLTLFFALLLALVACGDDDLSGGGGTVPTADAGPGEVRMTALSVTPATLTLAAGTTGAVRASAAFSDGTTRDVTASASWSSSDDAVATADNGTVTAHAVGAATLTVRSGSLDRARAGRGHRGHVA